MKVESILNERRAELTRKKNENDFLARQILEIENEIISEAEKTTIYMEAIDFLEKVANSRRKEVKGQIEDIINEAVQLVYGPNLRVEFTYALKNNRSQLEIECIKTIPEGEVRRLMDGEGSGLGVHDIVAVCLRLMILIGNRKVDRVCVLDEAFKHAGDENIPVIARFLKTIADKLSTQVIMFSHHEQMKVEADRAYHVMERDGVSKVEQSEWIAPKEK